MTACVALPPPLLVTPLDEGGKQERVQIAAIPDQFEKAGGMTAANRRQARIPRQEISEASCQLKFPNRKLKCKLKFSDGKYQKIETPRQEVSEASCQLKFPNRKYQKIEIPQQEILEN